MNTINQNTKKGLFAIASTKGLCIVLLIASTSAFSQMERGANVLTVGTSKGFFIRKPSFNATYDYAFVDKFSVGLGVTYTDCTYLEHPELGNLSRTNIGVRSLFHFGPKTNWDFYTGLRVGASFWSGTGYGYHRNEPINETQRGGSVIPTAQVLFGGRYLVSDRVGLNSEIAFGFPYTFSIGVSIKIEPAPKVP